MSNLVRKPIRGLGSGSGGDAVWGGITGNLPDQTDLQTALDAKIDTAEKGVANGVAALDANGRVPAAQLPFSATEYLGTWNATTNTPIITAGVGVNGTFYICNVAGDTSIDGISDWGVGDLIIFDGALNAWQRVPAGNSTEAIDLQSYYFIDTVNGNEYVINSASGANPSSLYVGLRVSFVSTQLNTGPVTVKIGSLPAAPVIDSIRPLIQGDIIFNGLVSLVYDGTQFQVIKKNLNVLINDQGVINSRGIFNNILSFLNSNPYLNENIAPFNITGANDKQLVYLDANVNVVNLPDLSSVAANFSITLLYNLFDPNGTTITFNPQPSDTVLAEEGSVPQLPGAPKSIKLAFNGVRKIVITRNLGTIWFVDCSQQTTETLAGVTQLATQAEVDAGVNATKIVTPATNSTFLSNNYVDKTTDQEVDGVKTFVGTLCVERGTKMLPTGDYLQANWLETTNAIDPPISFAVYNQADATVDANANYFASVFETFTGSNTVNYNAPLVASNHNVTHNGTGVCASMIAQNATVTNANTGTISFGIVNNLNFQNAGTIDFGYVSYISDATNTGTITTQVGQCIEDLSAGVNNTQLLLGTNNPVLGNHAIYSASNKVSTFVGEIQAPTFTGNLTGNADTATNVNYAPPANSIYGAATTTTQALTNYDAWKPFGTSVQFVCAQAPAGGTGSLNHPFQTLVEADAATGTEFLVSEGTYADNLTINFNRNIKFKAFISEKALFTGNNNGVEISGTVTVSSAADVTFDGFTFNNTVSLSAVAGGDEVFFNNCVFNGAISITGSSSGNIRFMGCRFNANITQSSTNANLKIAFSECQGNVSSAFVCTTDMDLLFIERCSQWLSIDYRGPNLYINELQSIAADGTNTTIKFRGPGGLANNTGICSLLGQMNTVAGAASKLDINCATLSASSEGVVRNSANDQISFNTLITPTPF
jgi:hypothetical protein